MKVFFGDAMRPDLLHAAGIEEARMLVIAIDDRESATELVRYMKKHHPAVYLVVRATDRHHVYELWRAGARDIVRETFDSSVRAGRSALEALGLHPYDADRHVQGFVLNDKEQMIALASSYDPGMPVHKNEEYVRRTREYLDKYAGAMKGSAETFGSRLDRGWVPPRPADIEAVVEAANESKDNDPETSGG